MRLVPLLLWALAVLFVAVFVHLGSILVLPEVAPQSAFFRVAAGRAAAVVSPLSPAAARDGTPFRDPMSRSAVCRYDLSSGPLRVVAGIDQGDFVAVSFHSRSGLPFYALTDRAGVDGRIDVLLVTPAQLEQFEAADGDEPARNVRVVAPQTEGFVQFDVLPRIGGSAAAERTLTSMTCKVEASP